MVNLDVDVRFNSDNDIFLNILLLILVLRYLRFKAKPFSCGTETRGGSRAAATPKIERFVIIVHGF